MSASDLPRAPFTSATSYRRVCRLASGGLAHVDLALRKEGRFQRLYAIKRLQSAYRDDTEFHAMFLEEARLAGLIRHANVVSVLDVGEDDDGPFLVMDYVDGVSAGMLTAAAAQAGRELPLQVCLRIAVDAARGLHAAHVLRDDSGRAMNLVHRDVSPQNLLVGYDGVTRVTDFGIAKALGGATKTATGVLKGKFGYMSPEQLRFEEADQRSDLFALGVVLFELVSGARLYPNRNGMDGSRRILTEPPPDLGDHRDDLPAELVRLMFSLLAKDPDHRPGDAKEVARVLDSVHTLLVSEEGSVDVGAVVDSLVGAHRAEERARIAAAMEAAEEPTRVVSARRAYRGHPVRRWAVGFIAFAILFGVGAWFVAWDRTHASAEIEG